MHLQNDLLFGGRLSRSLQLSMTNTGVSVWLPECRYNIAGCNFVGFVDTSRNPNCSRHSLDSAYSRTADHLAPD